MKRVLLLGGGHAHVHVLSDFAREPLAGAEATLVTPFPRQMYSGMVPGLLAGHYPTEACAIRLEPLARAARVRFVKGSAIALDAARRQVTLADGSVIDYDVLSIDTGPVVDRDLIEGAREHALFVRPIEHFIALLEPLLDLASRRAIGAVVVGAGAAGVELALALAHRLDQAGSEGCRVTLVSAEPQILPGFEDKVRDHALAALRRNRVTVLASPCTAINATHVMLANGARVACDAPIVAIGAGAPPWLAGSGLALDERGFVATGPTLQSTSHPEVFAAGDVATRVDAPHPKSGVYAVRAGPPLALNLRRFSAGGDLHTHQPQDRTLYLLSTGAKRAILAWGPWSAEGRWVWWWKDRIDRGFIARYALDEAGSTLSTRGASAAPD